jgi:hypothetical protein
LLLLLLLLLLCCYISFFNGPLCCHVSLQPIHPQTLLLLLLAAFAVLHLLRALLARLHKRCGPCSLAYASGTPSV